MKAQGLSRYQALIIFCGNENQLGSLLPGYFAKISNDYLTDLFGFQGDFFDLQGKTLRSDQLQPVFDLLGGGRILQLDSPTQLLSQAGLKGDVGGSLVVEDGVDEGYEVQNEFFGSHQHEIMRLQIE